MWVSRKNPAAALQNRSRVLIFARALFYMQGDERVTPTIPDTSFARW
jgi:hypothetical protein